MPAENREAGRPKDEEADEWYWIRRKEKYGPPKIHWRSDPRELGLPKMDFNPEDVPWQEREPWRTIKTYLPPAMIDTEEKERELSRGGLASLWAMGQKRQRQRR